MTKNSGVKKPNNVNQTSGREYATFNNLAHIKNTSKDNYAYTDLIASKKDTVNPRKQPSTVSCTNFKVNIPSNAVVKKIKVHYRHSRRANCPTGTAPNLQPKPCSSSNKDKRANIGSPTITLLNIGTSKKGQAPYAQIGDGSSKNPTTTYGKLNNTLTFEGLWDASKVNSSNFGVKIDYPKNSNSHYGYVFLWYVYVEVEYDVPTFTVTAASANASKVYNKNEYHLKVNLSDKGLTKKSTNVLITLPAGGFSYKGIAGKQNGRLEVISARSLQWTPNMSSSSASLELIFDVDVSFSQNTSSANFTFTIGLPATSTQITHTATIYKELPPEQTIEDETTTPEPIITDKDIEIANRITAVEYEVITSNIEGGEFPSDDLAFFIFPVDEDGEIQFTEADTPFEQNTLNQQGQLGTWLATTEYSSGNYRGNPITIEELATRLFRGTYYGTYVFLVYEYVDSSLGVWSYYESETPLGKSYFEIVPDIGSLSTVNFTKLPLTEEELNRLGSGYEYTVQSDMKLITEENYVRNWYKNFRIGVFNNPILANITSYYKYDNTDTEFDGYFLLPTMYDLTDATLEIETDNPITLSINDVEYDITTSETITLSDEYNVPVHFTSVGNDNVVLSLTLYDANNQAVWEKDWHINFNAETTTDLEEITIDSTDYDNLTDLEIFTNAEYWGGTLTHTNTTESLTTDFTYNKNYPLYILITGDWIEGNPVDSTIQFNEPCIIESSVYTEREDNGTYPYPIDDLVVNENTTDLTLLAFEQSETIIFYDLPLDDHYGTNTEMAVRGIELTGEIEQSDQLVLYAKLKSPTGESRERSIVLDDFETVIDVDNTFHIGGNGDLWGFNTLDIVELEDWEVELVVSNTLEETDSSINFGKIKLIFYIETVEKQNITCRIEGEDVAYYGVFITNVDIPEGLETDTNYLNIDGTDVNDAYRQNIREKTITIEFDIGEGCSLEESTLSLREFSKLLVNDRDEYNRPIPKRIEFDHYPDVYWEYIMQDALDSEININTYECKAKLVIPAGTSYDRATTTTSNNGFVNGIASINPNIIIKPTDEIVTIRETISSQEFHIGYSGEWNDKIVEIDCENRIVWLKTDEDDTDPVNMNKYVDYNSDWFVLKGEYSFEGINCVIRTVDFEERW